MEPLLGEHAAAEEDVGRRPRPAVSGADCRWNCCWVSMPPRKKMRSTAAGIFYYLPWMPSTYLLSLFFYVFTASLLSKLINYQFCRYGMSSHQTSMEGAREKIFLSLPYPFTPANIRPLSQLLPSSPPC
jgi:hypothetical protein